MSSGWALPCAVLLAFGGSALAPDQAAARPRPAKAAKRAKRMEKVGKVAYKNERYDDAIIAFKAAYEALPKPKFLYNLARCHEKKGALAEAARHYERYLTEAPDAEDREAVETQASFLTEKLRQTMARLSVTSKPPGAALRIEGEGSRLDVATPWSGWLDPGRYELSVLAEGQEERRQKLALAAGQEREVAVDLEAKDEPDPPPAAPAVKAPKPPPATSTPAAARKPRPAVAKPPPPGPEEGLGTAPLAAFGVAAAAVVAGAVLGGLYLSTSGDLDEAEANPAKAGRSRQEMDDLADSANLYATLANVAVGVAALAGLTDGVLLVMGGDGGAAEAAVRWTW